MNKWLYRAVGTVGIASGVWLLGSGAAEANEAAPASTDPQLLHGLVGDLLTPLGGGAVVTDLTGTAGAAVRDLRVGDLSLVQVDHSGSSSPDDVLGSLPDTVRPLVDQQLGAGQAAPEALPVVDNLPLVGSLLNQSADGRGGGPLGGLPLGGLPVLGGLLGGNAAAAPDEPAVDDVAGLDNGAGLDNVSGDDGVADDAMIDDGGIGDGVDTLPADEEGLPAVGGLPLVGSLAGGLGGGLPLVGPLLSSDGQGAARSLPALNGVPVLGGLLGGITGGAGAAGAAGGPAGTGAAGVPSAASTLDAPITQTLARPAPRSHSNERPSSGEDAEYAESAWASAPESLPLVSELEHLPLLGALRSLPLVGALPLVNRSPLAMDEVNRLPVAGTVMGLASA